MGRSRLSFPLDRLADWALHQRVPVREARARMMEPLVLLRDLARIPPMMAS
jgi:hypothetical protein